MAIYRLQANASKNASSKQSYIEREGKYSNQSDPCVFSLSENLPAFANGSSSEFWKACDKHERANANKLREYQISLPIELTAEANQKLAIQFARDFSSKYGGDKGLPFTLAIHEGKGTNPHAHIIVCERPNSSDFSAKDFFSRKNPKVKELGGSARCSTLLEIRELWEKKINTALMLNNRSDAVVSCKTLAEQGIDRTPEIHIGPNGRHGSPERMSRNNEIKKQNYVQQYRKADSPQLKRLRSDIDYAKKELDKKPLVAPNKGKTQIRAVKKFFNETEQKAFNNAKTLEAKANAAEKQLQRWRAQHPILHLLKRLLRLSDKKERTVQAFKQAAAAAKQRHGNLKVLRDKVAKAIDNQKPLTEKALGREVVDKCMEIVSEANETYRDESRAYSEGLVKLNVAKVQEMKLLEIERLLAEHQKENVASAGLKVEQTAYNSPSMG